MTKPASKDVLPGSAVCLKSTFRGSGPFTVRWLKGGRELVSGGSCYITKEASESSLELYVVKTSDSGTYTCQVGNAAGSVECSANLFVKGWPRFLDIFAPPTPQSVLPSMFLNAAFLPQSRPRLLKS